VQDVEERAIGNIIRRLIPFLILCYFVAYLERVNLGFAAHEPGSWFSEAAFGLRAGLLFIGYFVFEVPSNIRVWNDSPLVRSYVKSVSVFPETWDAGSRLCFWGGLDASSHRRTAG
jgi:hypothetical protein